MFLSYDTAEQSHVCGRTEAALLALKIKGLTPACGRPRAAPEDPATLDSCGFGVARRRQPAHIESNTQNPNPIFKITIYYTKYTKNTKIHLEKNKIFEKTKNPYFFKNPISK